MMVLLRSLLVWILGGSLTISLASIAILFSLFKAQIFVHKIAIILGKKSLLFMRDRN